VAFVQCQRNTESESDHPKIRVGREEIKFSPARLQYPLSAPFSGGNETGIAVRFQQIVELDVFARRAQFTNVEEKLPSGTVSAEWVRRMNGELVNSPCRCRQHTLMPICNVTVSPT
jgi:hypothetical protein